MKIYSILLLLLIPIIFCQLKVESDSKVDYIPSTLREDWNYKKNGQNWGGECASVRIIMI